MLTEMNSMGGNCNYPTQHVAETHSYIVHFNCNERMNPFDFGDQRSEVKVTMGIYGNNLNNMTETEP